MARPEFDAYRRRVIKRASGDVLELGIGAGHNLAYYSHAVRTLTAVDPSERLLQEATGRAADLPFPVNVVPGRAEKLPLEDHSVDTVVSTWVLCSVEHPLAALTEARRVLRPGGRFLFVEHGHSPDRSVCAWQKALNPVWRRIAGGCNLTRRIEDLIRDAGFTLCSLDTGYMPTFKPQGYTYEGLAQR